MLRQTLKKCNWLRKIYKVLIAKKFAWECKKREKKIHKKGNQTIRLLQNLLTEFGCDFFFDMGTLLGIIREGHLLGFDLDIDIGVMIDDETRKTELKAFLLSKKCRIKHCYAVEEIGVVEESYLLNNIKFDINYYSTDGDASVCYLLYKDPEKTYTGNQLSTVKLTCDPITEIQKIDFNGSPINVPTNPEAYLARRYGENWRIPDRNYIYWKGPSTEKIDNPGTQTH